MFTFLALFGRTLKTVPILNVSKAQAQEERML